MSAISPLILVVLHVRYGDVPRLVHNIYLRSDGAECDKQHNTELGTANAATSHI
jgi:hypothetical protein